jgi:hypothetical protein
LAAGSFAGAAGFLAATCGAGFGAVFFGDTVFVTLIAFLLLGFTVVEAVPLAVARLLAVAALIAGRALPAGALPPDLPFDRTVVVMDRLSCRSADRR